MPKKKANNNINLKANKRPGPKQRRSRKRRREEYKSEIYLTVYPNIACNQFICAHVMSPKKERILCRYCDVNIFELYKALYTIS